MRTLFQSGVCMLQSGIQLFEALSLKWGVLEWRMHFEDAYTL